MTRREPPRWAKLAVWVGLGCLGWLTVAVLWMAWTLWPWPSAVLTAMAVGVIVGAVWGRRPVPDLELVHERKDMAIEACLDTAFELQAVTGEHPVSDDTGTGTVRYLSGEQPAIYDQDADTGSYRARLS